MYILQYYICRYLYTYILIYTHANNSNYYYYYYYYCIIIIIMIIITIAISLFVEDYLFLPCLPVHCLCTHFVISCGTMQSHSAA